MLFQPRLKIAALVALIIGSGLGVWRAFVYQSPGERGLVALNDAYKQQRPLEARVTGMSYAPHSGKRGAQPENVDFRARDLSRSLLLGAASDNQTPSTLHASGRFYLLEREFDKAIAEFQGGLNSASEDAGLQADLGAALYEQAKVLRDRNEDGKAMETLAESQEHLSTALRLNPSLLEARFNRALVLEELMLHEQARQSWQKYLELDPRSDWSKDAQRHLQSSSEDRTPPSTPEEMVASFMSAFRSRDETEAWRLLSDNREVITGKMISLRLAQEFVSHSLKGEEAEARDKLSALVFAGELDKRKGNDPYTADLAAYYAKSSRATLQLLSKAAEGVKQGYELCLATKYEEAASRFTSARATFDEVGDKWEARLADYWIAYCLSQPNRTQDSNAVLKTVAEFCEAHGYKWLLALTNGWLGSNHIALNDYSLAIKYTKQSLALAEEVSDTYLIQRALMSLGDLYARLRQPEASLAYHYRNLRYASAVGATPRQAWRNLTYFAGALFAFKHYDAAALIIDEALRRAAATQFNDPSLLYMQHLNLGQIYSKLRQFDTAITQAETGLDIARSVQDPKARMKPVANSILRQAEIWREAGQCVKAVANYDQAISQYEEINLDLYRYAAYKGRLLCERDLNNDVAVQRDLNTILALFEKYRSQIREEENRNSFFDAEQSVYDIAVEYEYERHNELAAFKYAEAAHGRSLLDAVQSGARIELTNAGPEMAFGQVSTPADLETLRQHMPPRMRVLMFSVLQTKLLVWSISRDEFSVVSKEISAEALGGEVNSYVKALTTEISGPNASTNALSAKLYDTLLGSVVKAIKPDDVVCIIPDKFLHRLPFAALVSPNTGKYLIEEWPIFYASSLNVLSHCTEAGRNKTASEHGTILSIGNPAFDLNAHPELSPLRAAEKEARAVAELYEPANRSRLLLGPQASKERVVSEMNSAEIIHFAGHYVVDPAFPLLSKMLLAGGEKKSNAGGQDRDLAAFEIIEQQLHHTRLVVLSACQTGIDKYHESEGAVGLARAFIAAGVPIVVASQWPVDSEATAKLMISFHHYRLTGLNTSESLRKAQVDMLRSSDEAYKSPYYWAAFLCAGGYVDY